MSDSIAPDPHQHQHLTAAGRLQNRQEYGPPALPHHHLVQHPPIQILPGPGNGGVALEDAVLTPNLRRGSLASSADETTPGVPHDGASTTPSPGSSHSHNPLQLSPPSAAGSLTPKPIRRRMRMITSCLECRRRKLKCNKSSPCTNCIKFSRDCLYLGPKLDEASQLKLTEMKEKVGSLERQLEREVAVKSTTRDAPSGAGGFQQRILADDVEDEYEGEVLEITPMVALDVTYEDDVEGMGTDDLIDLGIRVGRMRITERIGGLNRPRISEEILAGITSHPTAGYMLPGFPSPEGMFDPTSQEVNFPEFLRPGASYIAPTGGFFFGQVLQSPSISAFLPTLPLDGDWLIRRYFHAVHPIARCVHRASFQLLYDSFRKDVKNWVEPRASTQAVVFAAWFSAAVSLDEADVMKEYGFSKNDLVTKMKLGTESALSKADFLRTTKVETLQAFVMFLLPLCRDEVSRAHSVLVGAAVRMAECMGLHRDGEAYGLGPLETHVRRLIWHQLCFLDIRTCEAQGPKPAIRREDYDTLLPINCEEDELTAQTVAAPQPAEGWTSTLFSIMRFEINEMMRIIWSDRRKLEMRKVSLTTVLTKIETFRKAMAEKYNHFLDENVPIQNYAKQVMHLLTCRLHAMILHPYHSNTKDPMPDRLNNLLVFSGVTIIETAVQLECGSFFRDWRWYIGAYQQYQIALLLATETYYRPASPLANRIWACLDYVFDLDPNLPREAKSLRILTEIMGKTAVYMGLRKMRAPTAIAKAVPDRQAVKDSPSSPGTQPTHQGSPPALAYQQMMGLTSSMKAEGGGVPPQLGGMMSGLHSPFQGGNQQHNGMAAMPMTFPQNHLPQMDLPPQNMVFGGVSNGEVLWGLPPVNSALNSPENSSEGGSPENMAQRHGSLSGASGLQTGNSIMEGIDWGQMDLLFPPDFNFNTLIDSNVGLPTLMLGATKWP